MNIKTLKKVLSVIVISLTPFGSEAATALAQVTANIVPITSFAVTGAAVFSGSTMKHDNKGIVSLSTSGKDSAAKLVVLNSGNFTYDVSISSPAGFTDKTDKTIKIVKSKFNISKGGLTAKGGRELEFGGDIEMLNSQKNGSHYTTVNITTNYN
jgi:hypothetical protein